MFSQTGFIINPNILVEKLVIEMSQKIAAGYLQFCSKTVEEMLENHVFFPPSQSFPLIRRLHNKNERSFCKSHTTREDRCNIKTFC